ncbi:MAG TPA: pyruvate dehydrogenase (acetyl-transferring), homodimeric type [Acidimicrobiia bacterium]|nr:pyruvate dehydrogenase (acetyl-transferring), homodimeric type [Acidimicrobiia bacterium]
MNSEPATGAERGEVGTPGDGYAEVGEESAALSRIFPDEFIHQFHDRDPEETKEWIESLDSVAGAHGPVRARYLLAKLLERAHQTNIGVPPSITTPYVNSIPRSEEPEYPGDEHIERRIRRFIRWNAAVMVVKANHREKGIGGHLSTFASSATLYEVGFNHFFRGKDNGFPGDHVYFQGHAAPGMYARSFLERRLDEQHLDNFRFEIDGHGLSSYPHPRLMADFWEYPTVSMGLGPINSIYQARFNRYLHHRGLDDTSESRVWCFIGDGEVDEPETLGSITLASREKLDNLTWVINCNLQRLDGPVRGNGKIIQELESIFRGAGWNVIKVIWGSGWDPLLAADHDGALVQVMNDTLDGEYQRYKAEDGAYVRQYFFGKDPRALALVKDWSDDEIWALRRGGLDFRKVYAAYKMATELKGAPTVILAKTIKGWTLGPDVEGRNATHQIKELTNAQLRELRERIFLHDEIPEESLEGDREPPYYRPPEDSPEFQYLMERRKLLHGPLPSRLVRVREPLTLPGPEAFTDVYAGSAKVEASTTTAFTRLLRNLCRVPGFGPRVVPIVPDEARTFGMDSLFRELKIYASQGQLYEPVDAKMLLSYVESRDGQILEEGITEAGSMASWIAAATNYANRGMAMVPFFIFYSMFGFQRVGDLLWAAGDARARGFVLGATAGRTTLAGEGLQHQDGHSLVLASTNPAVEAYDPAFAYEVGTIIEHGIGRMWGDQPEDVFFYLTLYNENYIQPPRPEGSAEGIVAGLYRWAPPPESTLLRAGILFSGTANLAARAAQADLAEHYGVGAELWSVTSYQKLRDQAMAVERWNRLHPGHSPATPWVTEQLASVGGPLVAVSDYMKLVPDQIGRFVPGTFVTLGTDGFGRSDGRARLRRFFETDKGHVVLAVLSALIRAGKLSPAAAADAISRYGLDPEAADPRFAH